MAGVNESAIEEIKARTDLAELIESYGVQVRRAGASLKACCPFHHEKTPSFNINPNRGFYHCFGCGESGDAIKFVEKMEGLSFMDAVKKLAAKCGVKIEERQDPEAAKRRKLYALMAELAQFYRRCLLLTKEAAGARAYLAQRELDEKTCGDWLVGYAPNGVAPVLKWAGKHGYSAEDLEAAGVVKPPSGPGDSGYHRFGGRLMFTIRDRQGRVVAFSGRLLEERKNTGKYVNSPETVIFRKSNVLFGFDRAAANIVKRPNREAIACEGQIDTIRLHMHGFTNAVASQGTAFTEEHAAMLRRVADSMTLVYDDDNAGHKAAVKIAAMMLAHEVPVRVACLTEGDDPDSFLRKKGAEAFQRVLDAAESIMAFQCRVERAKERRPDSVDAVARISKAVLATVAGCPNAVLRASMCGEAAALLKLPTAALAEELERVRSGLRAAPKPKSAPVAEEVPHCDDEPPPDALAEVRPAEPPVAGESAALAEPPPGREMALLAFLLTNERDAELDKMLGEFLPPSVFAHDFTRRFVEAWRAEAAGGDEDVLAAFAAGLAPTARGWFDRVLLAGGRTESSTLPATEILQDFIRTLWATHLKRLRGALPATGDAEADRRRLRLSTDIKRLAQARWNTVKGMVRQYASEG